MRRSVVFLLAGCMALMMGACGQRALEKKIAEMESRLAALESKGNTNPNTPTANPTPQNTTPDVKPEGPLPVLEFESMDHDFGTVAEGQKVSYTYKLKNTGQAPLIIQSAQPSCGCTVPKWTQEPIPVGGSGFVTAEFDTNGKQGINNKTITVTANTWPKTNTLRFKAMVTPKTEVNGPTK